MLRKREYLRRKLLELHEQQKGLCHWCQRYCYLPHEEGYRRPKHGNLGGKAATVDHLYSRLNPLRWTNTPPGPRHVMACMTCNGKRGKAECLAGMQETKPPVPQRFHWKRG